ncbi:hypothetical protein [Paraburkholderia sp. CI3]
MSGGASVGERDMTRSALTSLGASFVLCGMRMKPASRPRSRNVLL